MPDLTGKGATRPAVAIRIFALATACVLWASSAGAADLRNIRIGNHPDKTRVVFELNGAADYRIVSRTADEIVVRLSADAAPEAMAGNGSPLLWVRVEPRVGGADVRLQVASSVTVKEMVLTEPDRVVLDLVPGAAPPVVQTPQPALSPAPVAPPPVVSEPVPAAVAETTPSEPLASEIEAQTGEGLAEVDGLASLDEPAPEPETRQVAVVDPTPERIRPPPAPAPTAKSSSGSPLAILGNPIVLAAVGLVVVLLGVWAMRRRSGAAVAEDFEDDATDLAAGASTAAVSSDAEAAEPTASPEVAETEASSESPSSLFDVDEAEVVAEEPGLDDDAPAPVTAGVAAVSAAVAPLDTSELGDDMAAIVQEIERRMAHFETRLEEVVDAKERLERQVAAQTEELRVQRAAIARTQRVLRGISRPEDEASEPVPK